MSFDLKNFGLEPLFKEAREKGRYFHCYYQDLWFSPDELRKLQAEGHFRWEAANWELRDPKERTEYLRQRVIAAQKEFDEWVKKVGQ